jgi:hypothetical protein
MSGASGPESLSPAKTGSCLRLKLHGLASQRDHASEFPDKL